MTTLPSAAELHRMAREGSAPPIEFADARKAIDNASEVLASKRNTMHDLIREAHTLGIGPAVLARWSGYDPSRIYQILG